MEGREQQVLALIREDPMLPQQAIADRLGMTRSAVAAHIMNLTNKGLIQGRGYVTPQDVKTVAPDVMRHRVILTYEAEAEEKTSEDIIEQILGNVDVP